MCFIHSKAAFAELSLPYKCSGENKEASLARNQDGQWPLSAASLRSHSSSCSPIHCLPARSVSGARPPLLLTCCHLWMQACPPLQGLGSWTLLTMAHPQAAPGSSIDANAVCKADARARPHVRYGLLPLRGRMERVKASKVCIFGSAKLSVKISVDYSYGSQSSASGA